MKNLIYILMFLALGFNEAFAVTITVNPNVPATSSPLSSSVIRNNFGAVYNDETALLAAITALNPITWPTSGYAVISNGTSSPLGVAEIDGDCLKGVAGAWTTGSCGSGSSGLVVGTTTITNGTSGYVEYNNGGVVGEKATTGSGSVVLATSPSVTVVSTLATAARTLQSHFSDVYNAADWGVTCGGTALVDINITNGTATASSASYTFVAGDVGKVVVLTDTNETVILNTTISSISSGNAVLAANWTNSSLTNHTGRMTFYPSGQDTSNTTDIAAAITDITAGQLDANGHNTRGFKLMFPNGVCATGQVVQPRLSILACAGGAQACELFLKSGINADFMVSENFASLTGGGLNYGPSGTYNGRTSDPRVPSWFGLQDMHLDCNKLGQTQGRCVAWYGNMEMMLGTVQMEEAYGVCMHTEASDASAWSLTDWKGFEEGIFDHVRTRNCGSYGWEDEGPHDKVVMDFIDAESGAAGYHSSLSSGYYSGTGHLVKMHAYAETGYHAFYIGTPDSIDEIYPDYGNLEIASAGVSIAKAFYTAGGYGNVPALLQDAGAYRLNMGQINLDAYPTATGISLIDLKAGAATLNVISTGIESTGTSVIGINAESSFNIITANLQNIEGTTSTCLSIGGSNNVINLTDFSCTTGIDPTSDGGNNIIHATQYSDTAFTSGYPFAATDYVNLTDFTGSVSSYFTQTPSNKSSLGEIQTTGTTPAVASGSSACGTSASVVGNNRTGVVTVGSSTNGGVCTLTFAGSLSFTHAPVCWVYDVTTPTNLVHPVTTVTTLAITAASAITAGDKLNYLCEGYY